MGRRVEVLDKGFARLVDHMGSDLAIARSARVSYDADWRAGEDKGSDARLIRYLWRNGHTSPFESVVFTFEIKCPIFVARQWMRHRTWSFNEVSARYTELDEGYYIPDAEQVTTQSSDNKQMRTDEQHPEAQRIRGMIDSACTDSVEAYRDLLRIGAPRELARSVLAVAAYTRFFGTIDLHNLLKFISLRAHEHSQWEIRQYAEALLALVRPVCPVAMSAFEEAGQ